MIEEIRRLLTGHPPADAREERAIAEAIAGLSSTSASRLSFTPGHVTASALVFSADGLRIALVWHVGFGKWIQPGGHLEPGDAGPEAAALREVEEEIGATEVTPLGLVDVEVHAVPDNPRRAEPAHRHYDLRFAFQASGPVLTVPGVRWLPIEEITAEQADESVVLGVARWRRRS